ncbi:hypothetical protein CAOG_02430 [Capsaspora owczarzaki ATCC 30864]|uniref:F-box domain-containing protein n=1 Tax=Capsaspora owczarzaki (strain ATCC 30864) TaxID=595528 RepID=A0A0D2WL81_CAPO3|nr:hypothetical protein CAOG_02430 [Capsaspora owczarzaki ATCC 30864]KJE91270.1 hypothetical protein CAOG_002430 [Capsaspora owczarzaki ATCC 30864]|eukprot:XP_004349180.1 hypothetical protein CAOG_02430 [Capsaspora owczarzaki ATCC 30864]
MPLRDVLFPMRARNKKKDAEIFMNQAQDVWTWFAGLLYTQQQLLLDGLLQRCATVLHAHIASELQAALKRDFLATLPVELSLHIVSFIDDPQTLCSMAQVSRTWNQIASDNFHWHRLCLRRNFIPFRPEQVLATRMEQAYEEMWWGMSSSTVPAAIAAAAPTANLATIPGAGMLVPSATFAAGGASFPAPSITGEVSSSSAMEAAISAAMESSPMTISRSQSRPSAASQQLSASLASHHGSLGTANASSSSYAPSHIDMMDESHSSRNRPRLSSSSLSATPTGRRSGSSSLSVSLGNHGSGLQSMDGTVSSSLSSSMRAAGHLSPPSHSAALSPSMSTAAAVSSSTPATTTSSSSTSISSSASSQSAAARPRSSHVSGEPSSQDLQPYYSATPQNRTALISLYNAYGGNEVDWKSVFGQYYRETMRLQSNWRRGVHVKHEVQAHTEEVTCVRYTEDRLVCGSYDGLVKVWDMKENLCLGSLMGHGDAITCVAFNESIIVSGSLDHSLRVWDANTGRAVRALMGHTAEVECVAIDATRIVSGSWDNTLRVWSVETGHCINTLSGHRGSIYCVQFDADKIVSGSGDRTVKFWSWATGTCYRTIEAHNDTVTCLQFDHELLVTGSYDCDVKVWSMESGTPLFTLRGHVGEVWCLQFDALANRIISGSNDGTIRVWNLQAGQCNYVLRHGSAVNSLQFDDRKIISGSSNKALQLWDFSAQ